MTVVPELQHYRVDTRDGPIGFVDHVVLSQEGEPQALAVRVGRFRPRLVVVPLADVVEISPKWDRVVLGSTLEI